jgi:hypothetical protein
MWLAQCIGYSLAKHLYSKLDFHFIPSKHYMLLGNLFAKLKPWSAGIGRDIQCVAIHLLNIFNIYDHFPIS